MSQVTMAALKAGRASTWTIKEEPDGLDIRWGPGSSQCRIIETRALQRSPEIEIARRVRAKIKEGYRVYRADSREFGRVKDGDKPLNLQLRCLTRQAVKAVVDTLTEANVKGSGIPGEMSSWRQSYQERYRGYHIRCGDESMLFDPNGNVDIAVDSGSFSARILYTLANMLGDVDCKVAEDGSRYQPSLGRPLPRELRPLAILAKLEVETEQRAKPVVPPIVFAPIRNPDGGQIQPIIF